MYDVDNTGTIHREKMKQIVRAMITMAGDRTPHEDVNGRVAKIYDHMDKARRI